MSITTPADAPVDTTPPPMGPSTGEPPTIEAWLLGWLERALGAEPGQIDRDLPFRKMGVRSLQVVELMADVEDVLHIELDPADLMEFPTAAALAAHLVERGAVAGADR